jgi:Protein of unknown function (DUF2778)
MQGTLTTFDDFSFDCDRDSRRVFLQFAPGLVAVAALTLWVGAWGLHGRPAAAPDFFTARNWPIPTSSPPATVATNPYGEIFDPGFLSSTPYGEIFDPRFSSGSGPASLASDFSLQASLGSAQSAPAPAIPQPESVPSPPKREVDQFGAGAPMPPSRPAEFETFSTPVGPVRGSVLPNERVARPAVPADNRTFIEKLFGLGQPPAAAVAYARPEGRSGGKAFIAASPGATAYDRWTAVYDISARTVYLPDGTRLEAHSGLGDRLDDPRYVSERARGATPPHLYELEPREASFHGVQALRLLPIGQGDLYGRAGLLAHSFMLGPNGDSNGCVSFKYYDAFLRAYQNGQVRRLAVVARLD